MRRFLRAARNLTPLRIYVRLYTEIHAGMGQGEAVDARMEGLRLGPEANQGCEIMVTKDPAESIPLRASEHAGSRCQPDSSPSCRIFAENYAGTGSDATNRRQDPRAYGTSETRFRGTFSLTKRAVSTTTQT
jgi:hypothetical protein